jgi:hypothetical protein
MECFKENRELNIEISFTSAKNVAARLHRRSLRRQTARLPNSLSPCTLHNMRLVSIRPIDFEHQKA